MDINIEEIIKRQIEGVDIVQLVREEIRSHISKDITDAIKAVVGFEVQKLAGEEIANALSAPVVCNDGWGKIERAESFEEYFRTKFKEALKTNYAIQDKISKGIKERIDALIKLHTSQVVEKVVDELTNSRLVKK